MSYFLSDKDLGMDCNFVARGETPEEVKTKLFEHAMEAHADIFVSLTAEQQEEMSKKIGELIKQE